MTAKEFKDLCERITSGELLKHTDSEFVIYSRRWLIENAETEIDLIRTMAVLEGKEKTEISAYSDWKREALSDEEYI